jgi:site-specific recombinase XerD
MDAIALVPPCDSLQERAISTALSGLAATTRRVYESRIRAWLRWRDGTTALDRESVKRYLRALELAGCSAQVRNQALAALKKLAGEAADLGWIAQEQAAQIERIKGKKTAGVRVGRWLNEQQTVALLAAPDPTTAIGRRDRCLLALLVGCGLRRAEAVALTTDQLVTRDGRMLIRNLVGKGGRVRSVSVPGWAAQLIAEWIEETKQCTDQQHG